jgi:hypothetical protein
MEEFRITYANRSTFLSLKKYFLRKGLSTFIYLKVWPYLLGHYPFGSTIEERLTQDRAMQTTYETTMSEWLAVEAIIRQRDKEITAASIAKISLGSQSGEQVFDDPTEDQSRRLSNEV